MALPFGRLRRKKNQNIQIIVKKKSKIASKRKKRELGEFIHSHVNAFNIATSCYFTIPLTIFCLK